jgi:hypothetical protein
LVALRWQRIDDVISVAVAFGMGSYKRFIVMTLTSTVAMFGLMYLNTLEIDHVNLGIFAGSAVLFAVALWLVRSQETVSDVAYMKAMIPHHSIAILTSERAHISDPRLRRRADGIIESQRHEIDEMKVLIKDLQSRQ